MDKTKDEIAAIARRYLTAIQIGDITVGLDTTYIQRREFAWHIGVRPTHYPARMYYLYDELAAVADTIADKEGVNVFFVVGQPLATDEPIAATV